MLKILTITFWLSLIIIPLIWFFNNNGWVQVVWLGHLVKIDVLTLVISSLISLWLLYLIYQFSKFILSIINSFFGIFKTNELKKKNKEIEKYEYIIDLIKNYLKALNLKNIKEAKNQQKKINSKSKNQELKLVIKEHLENLNGLNKN
jgi:hypothetical protein